MIRIVNRPQYQTSDGEVFNTIAEAVDHESVEQVRRLLLRSGRNDNSLTKTIAGVIASVRHELAPLLDKIGRDENEMRGLAEPDPAPPAKPPQAETPEPEEPKPAPKPKAAPPKTEVDRAEAHRADPPKAEAKPKPDPAPRPVAKDAAPSAPARSTSLPAVIPETRATAAPAPKPVPFSPADDVDPAHAAVIGYLREKGDTIERHPRNPAAYMLNQWLKATYEDLCKRARNLGFDAAVAA